MNQQLHDRLRDVRLVAMDVDGVMTDGKAFYGAGGIEGVSFSVQDGSGIKYLHRSGIPTAIITGRSLAAVRARAKVLGIEYVYLGALVKMDAYGQLKQATGLADGQILYIGDDLPDVPVMRVASVAVAVANAVPEVREIAHFVTRAHGGEGAVREVAEMVLKAQGLWADILSRYFS